MTRTTLVVIFFLFMAGSQNTASCQNKAKLRSVEDSLQLVMGQIRNAGNDSIKESLNSVFKQHWQRALMIPGSFDYPFDSLKTVSKLMAPDKKFRIFTWNLPKSDGTNRYDGFILINPKDKPAQPFYILSDQSDTILLAETAILNPGNWYGATYYNVLLNEYHGTRYYTLIGWDGLNSLVTQKIIDVLYFDVAHQPHFGAKIFRNYKDNTQSRVIFRYSANATMFLNYDEQYLPAKKKWNPSRKQFETDLVKTFMIVCDELIPPDPQLEGLYEYYVPSSETFNGFVFTDGCWLYFQNIDARNQ